VVENEEAQTLSHEFSLDVNINSSVQKRITYVSSVDLHFLILPKQDNNV